MKLLSVFLLLTLLPFTPNKSEAHKYYVSVTKIDYVKSQESLQIISQIFIDDFENLIRQRYDDSITLGIEDESSMVDHYIDRYLKAKLLININGDAAKLDFIGKEYKDDIVYCYIEVTNISEINTITITNKILFDVFEDQQNIVRTSINGKDKSFILTSADNKGVLNFN